jgi:hypothetical protein
MGSFEDYENKVLVALQKLNSIKELALILRRQEGMSQNLALSLEERARYIEDNAYVKLEQFLKMKMKDFESPL